MTSTEQDKMMNADRFMAVVDMYSEIRELTPAIPPISAWGTCPEFFIRYGFPGPK